MSVQIYNTAELRSAVAELPWHHSIDFGDSILSPGKIKLEVLRAQAEIYFKDGLAGKSFLDIGCWDGFNSIEAKRCGASRVLATDHFAWSPDCWGNRRSFELARAHLAPDIEVMDIDLSDLSLAAVGTFDVVLFAGVFYHLRNPLLALERLAPLATETFIIETHLDAVDYEAPAMVFYPGRELNDDPTNWWGPNARCVLAMLRDVGFADAEFTPHPLDSNRAIFHGQRTSCSKRSMSPEQIIARAQLEEKLAEPARIKAERDQFEAMLRAIYNSTSWKLTRPVRGLKKLLTGRSLGG